jgi:1-phosphofructokinase
VGGKGINVSKMLSRLGVANTAWCFTGGASGRECEAWLESKHFSFHAFATTESTRTGTVIRSRNQPETTFLGPDIAPSPAAITSCAAELDRQPDAQVLALCGSFPGWNDSSFDVLRGALERWSVRGILAVDTYGPSLAWLVRKKVALVKINAVELQSLGGAASISDALSALASLPVARWVISNGPNEVTFREDQKGKLQTITPPRVQEISATGSGDVMFACLLHGLFGHQVPLNIALDRAVQMAAANAAHPGVAEFPDLPHMSSW